MVKLYDYYRSSASFRVRLALNIKKVDYDVIPVHLLNNGGEHNKDEYIKLNPQALVPTLMTNEGIITQSIAIIEWLNEKYPNPPLLPAQPYERALVRSFALTITSDIHPLNNLRVLKYLTQNLKITDAQKGDWYRHWVTKGLVALENQLNMYGRAGKFCFGDMPSLADLCLVPQIFNARRFNCDLSHCPEILRIDNNCQELEAVQNAWPDEALV